MTNKLLMGNAALAHAALQAGVNVVAGYPGTPSSEVIETVAALHASGAAQGVHVEWSTNEKAALELLQGASAAGARTLFTCKQMGLNVAADALMSLNYVGIRGGMVVFAADDPGPISSQTEQDTRRFAAFAKIPVFDPATPDQGFAMMQRAFEVSEEIGGPVIVRPTTRVNHASTFFEVQESTTAQSLPEGGFKRDPKWIIFPRRAYEAHGQINERLAALEQAFSGSAFDDFNPVHEVRDGQNAAPVVGIVCGGVSTEYALEALDMLASTCAQEGISLPSYRFMQVGTPYPFPAQKARAFAEGLERIIVFEELDYVLEDEMTRLAGRCHLSYEVAGKLTGDTLDRGENSTEVILGQLTEFFGLPAIKERAAAEESAGFQAPVRPPVLCPGCPHRGSFYAVKQAVGKRSAVYCGDIGCYTLGNAMPLDAVDTCLCMGGGITMAQGIAVADPQKIALSFVGDSTFFASGMTGVANAVYNQHNITVCVLDNSTTAMTGAQPHPGTGATLMGPTSKPLSIEEVLRSLGVTCITHANPFDLSQSTQAAKEAIDFEGPSAVIFQAPCIQLVKPQPAVSLDAQACTGCKKCITSIGCPALSFDSTGKVATVDNTLCNGCDLCVEVCPFGVIATNTAAQGEARAHA